MGDLDIDGKLILKWV